MKLEEACNRFNKLAGIKFGELFSPSDMNISSLQLFEQINIA